MTWGSAFTGIWSSTYGTIHLVQSGSHVDGTYASCNGTATISGQVVGRVLTGTWTQSCNSKNGHLRFTLSSDGKSFTGVWSYGTAPPTQPWNGTRT